MASLIVMQLHTLHLKIPLQLLKYWHLSINYGSIVEYLSPVKSVHGFSFMGFHSKHFHNLKENSVDTDIHV